MLNAENAAEWYKKREESLRERIKKQLGHEPTRRNDQPSDKAMKVLELFDSGERNFSYISRNVGLTRARIYQIASTVGIELNKNRRPIFQKICPVCQVTFQTKRENQIYCVKQCSEDAKFIREARKVCRMCRATEDLVKSGRWNFRQKYICRPCLKKRIQKYGYYQKKDDPKWVEKKRKYYREYHRKRRERIKGNKE